MGIISSGLYFSYCIKVDTSTPKRQLNKVSMKAALKEKKDIVKAYDEQKDRSLEKVKNRNAGLE